jgi:hypothetical protein
LSRHGRSLVAPLGHVSAKRIQPGANAMTRMRPRQEEEPFQSSQVVSNTCTPGVITFQYALPFVDTKTDTGGTEAEAKENAEELARQTLEGALAAAIENAKSESHCRGICTVAVRGSGGGTSPHELPPPRTYPCRFIVRTENTSIRCFTYAWRNTYGLIPINPVRRFFERITPKKWSAKAQCSMGPIKITLSCGCNA